MKIIRVGMLFLAAWMTAAAQSAPPAEQGAGERGFVSAIGMEGSFENSSHVVEVGTLAGYRFDRHVQFDVGLPFYLVSSTSSSSGSSTGVGNLAAALRFFVPNQSLNYATSLTAFAPTGNESLGLSSGRVTFDWTNHVDHSFGWVTPHLDLGFGDTVLDTPHLLRPYTTLGFNTHVAGGASFDVWKFVSLDASAYDILPSGTQKMYSLEVPLGFLGLSTPLHGRAFESNHFTSGTADLTKDNGFSGSIDLAPNPCVDFSAGYTRSVRYAMDSVSFGFGVNVAKAAQRRCGDKRTTTRAFAGGSY